MIVPISNPSFLGCFEEAASLHLVNRQCFPRGIQRRGGASGLFRRIAAADYALPVAISKVNQSSQFGTGSHDEAEQRHYDHHPPYRESHAGGFMVGASKGLTVKFVLYSTRSETPST